MHCNGFKHEKSLVKQKCKEFLAFNFLEVRFLVDSSSCSNNKNLTNAIVVPPRIVAAATRSTRTRMKIILMTVTRLALGLFVLYSSFPWVTAELRDCVYHCQYVTVVPVLPYVPYPAMSTSILIERLHFWYCGKLDQHKIN